MSQSRFHVLKDAFDWQAFGERITAEVTVRGSIRDVAEEIGAGSHTALYDRMRGQPCSVELLLFLCAEFNLSPWAFFRRPKRKR